MNTDKHVERIDILTGCGNLLAFLETFSARLASNHETAFSVLLIDLNNFMSFSHQRGHAQGDSLLHWVGIVLQDTGLPSYRLGDDEFLVAFGQETPETCEEIARSVFDRMNRESKQFDIANPASVILIHFQKEKLQIADLWIAISDALFDAKVFGDRGFLVNTYTHASAINNYQLDVINMLTERLLSFANRLDDTHQMAYLDPVTQLPNSIAAERELQRAIEESRRTQEAFSILFIDGDNMLRRLSELLSSHLRPGDFIARWRVGDEFLILLPTSTWNDAFIVAERLRSEVESKSRAWELAITISIGIAMYPLHGSTTEELLAVVEKAAKHSKDHGKNQITVLDNHVNRQR